MQKLSALLLIAVVAGCGNSTVTQQSGAAACITASACGILQGGISLCTQNVEFINDPSVAIAIHISASEVNCIAAAGSDCAKAKQCLGGNATPAVCTGNARSCMGNNWQACTTTAGSGGNSGIQVYDCSSAGPGAMCVASNGNIDCGYGTCQPGAQSTCVNGDGTPGSAFVQSCNNGILERQDCGRISAACNPSGLTPHCRGNGPTCAKTFGDLTLRCEGSVLVSCADGGEARYDCAKDSLGCYSGAGGNAFGCAAGNACDPNQYPATCVGTKLTFCNKGVVQTVDCGSAGFTTCSPNGGGACGK